MTIQEQAKERADRHAIAEAELHHGLGDNYSYARIYDSEIVSYEQGANDIIKKAMNWLSSCYCFDIDNAWLGDFKKAMEN